MPIRVWVGNLFSPFTKSRRSNGLELSKSELVPQVDLLLGHFSAAEDFVALEYAEDRIEAALLDLVMVLQALNHIIVGMRISRIHVERGRTSGADPIKPSLFGS